MSPPFQNWISMFERPAIRFEPTELLNFALTASMSCTIEAAGLKAPWTRLPRRVAEGGD